MILTIAAAILTTIIRDGHLTIVPISVALRFPAILISIIAILRLPCSLFCGCGYLVAYDALPLGSRFTFCLSSGFAALDWQLFLFSLLA